MLREFIKRVEPSCASPNCPSGQTYSCRPGTWIWARFRTRSFDGATVTWKTSSFCRTLGTRGVFFRIFRFDWHRFAAAASARLDSPILKYSCCADARCQQKRYSCLALSSSSWSESPDLKICHHTRKCGDAWERLLCWSHVRSLCTRSADRSTGEIAELRHSSAIFESVSQYQSCWWVRLEVLRLKKSEKKIMVSKVGWCFSIIANANLWYKKLKTIKHWDEKRIEKR